jgi:spore coat protein U-like protein
MLKRLSTICALVLTTLIAGAFPAAAACNLQLQDVSNVTWRGATGAGYGVFDYSNLAQAVTFKVENKTGSTCQFFIGVVSRSSRDANNRVLRDGPDTLRYQIYADSTLGTILRDTPEAAPSEVLSGFSDGKQTFTLQFYLNIAPLQVVSADSYDDQIEIRVYEGTVDQPKNLQDSKTFDFRAEVPTVADLSFTGASFDASARTTTLRFDPAQTGATGSVSLWARSNSGYILFAESQNGGVLQNTDPTETDVIRYSLRVDGRTVPLYKGFPFPVAARSDPTTASGWRHTFDFTLGTVDTQSGGEYKDVVTVSLIKY